MALITKGRIGPLQSTFYTLFSNLARDKVTGAITGRIVSYTSEEARRAHGAASAEYWRRVSDRSEAQKALDALKPADNDTAEQRRDKEVASVDARADLTLAAAHEKIAAEALEITAQQIGGPSGNVDINPADAPSYLTPEGAISAAALYTDLKTKPGFTDAQDA